MDIADLLFPTVKVLPKPRKNKSNPAESTEGNSNRSRQLLKPEQNGQTRGGSMPPSTDSREKLGPEMTNATKRSKSKEEIKKEVVIKQATPTRAPVPLTRIE